MLFNSLNFIYFFVVTYLIYVLLMRWVRLQNLFLLMASLFFYGVMNNFFLLILLISIVTDYFVGRWLREIQNPNGRKGLMVVSIVINLSILGFFKYFGFFYENLAMVVQSVGFRLNSWELKLLLPLGLSFYTFQAMSYIIDIYWNKIEPEKDFINYALFITFFPHMMAGPIQRPEILIPQIKKRRYLHLDQINAGLFLLIWGYFKKVVIADNLAAIANNSFAHYKVVSGFPMLLGIIAFTVQIYCDFSGYSDIARGLSKLMGFELLLNFKLPYFSSNPKDFWMRWHISLSEWMREYIYIPLGGNKKGRLRTFLNLMITMLLGGLWHGAAWNYVFWGGYHGIILIIHRIWAESKFRSLIVMTLQQKVYRTASVIIMFITTMLGWLIFRASSMGEVFYTLSHLRFNNSPHTQIFARTLIPCGVILFLMERIQSRSGDLMAFTKYPIFGQALLYGSLLAGIILFCPRESLEFIYFQF